jgi:hypothetical protein
VTAPGGYGFIPWVRSGLASLATTAPTQNYVSLQVGMTVNTTATTPVTVRLFGPGQVTGLDPRAIVRMEPLPNSTNFEDNYFPAVEFATPDFPWMFSPSVPAGATLMPWLCLVVVEVQPGVSLAQRPSALPVLQFAAPANPLVELPNLSEIAMWAHGQISGAAPANDDAVRAALTDPGSNPTSRIICPRRLASDTSYLACVVPTYNAGVQAGLSPDLPAVDTDLTPAWTASVTAPFSLPVYAYWQFSTGDAGDFESLAALIHPPTTPLSVGQAPMDESAPGFGMPTFPGLALDLEGALRAPNMSSTQWPVGVQTQFEHALIPILDPPPEPEPIVTPPLYGEWPASVSAVPAAGSPPVWLRDLNLDPRMRAAAGIGVSVVRADSADLVASAWDQFQQLRQANQRLRQFQLARVVGQSTLAQHLTVLASVGSFLQVTSALHSRLRLTLGATTATLSAQLAASRIPTGAVAPAFRRLTRRRGPLGRQLFSLNAPASQIVERLNQAPGTLRALAVLAPLVAPAGTVVLDALSSQTTTALLTNTAVAAAPGWGVAATARPVSGTATPLLLEAAPPNWTTDPQAPVWLRGTTKAFPVSPAFPVVVSQFFQMEANFRAAAAAVTTYISTRTAKIVDAPQLPPLAATLPDVQALVVAALDPTKTLAARAGAQLLLPAAGDPLRPQIGAPQFPRAMSLALTPQQLLPGVDTVPADSAAMLVTNPRFIEAYLIGLNDEIRRELAWRQYPVVSTATFFANFWGSAPDIPPIATWAGTNHLGANLEANQAQVVLLVRGQLLFRYPNTVVSAIPAAVTNGTRGLSASGELFPIFSGTIAPDMTFFGFALTEEQATANPGYYFVLAEHPSQPRFGLTDPTPTSAIQTWNDLSWAQVTVINNHVSVATPLTVPPPPEGGAWNVNAAQQAFITYRRPTRVGFFATALLG